MTEHRERTVEPGGSHGPARRTAVIGWLVVAVVVLGALAVAVWPRGGGRTGGPAAADLGADRTKAALAACPHPASKPPASSTLAGVRVICAADGRPVELANVLAGGPVLVNVWASWCEPCRQELPTLASYASSAGAISVLGMQVSDDDQRAGLDLLTSLGVHLPTVVDTDGSALRALRAPAGLPASFLISADGHSTSIVDPRVFTSVSSVRQTVTRYLTGADQ